MGRRGFLVWLIFWLLTGVAGAQEMELFKGEGPPGDPWRLRAGRLTYDAATHLYNAEGEVEIVQGDRRLTANFAQVSEITKIAKLKGNVVLVQGGDVLTGEEGVFNLVTRAGEMREARLFLRNNHFHVDGALIRKTGEQTYYAEKAVVTTCDADRPIWSFSARRLEVVLEGVAYTRNNTLRLAGVPVFYTPFAALPVLTQRQSGFLMPVVVINRSSGSVIQVPFFWAITNHADATFYQTYLTSRGYMQGLNLRYKGPKGASLDFQGIYLNDHREGAPPANRYWVAGMMDQPLTSHLNLRMTLDRVSDSSFLENFNYGYLGLKRYSKDLFTDFGRDLEQEEVKTRVSNLLVSGNFPYANLTAFGRYYQRLRTSEPYPYQRVPGLNFNTVTLPVGNLPFLVGVESSYGYFTQPRGNPGQTQDFFALQQGTQGQRLDIHPRIWFQTQVFPGLALDTRAGVRGLWYYINQSVPEGPQGPSITQGLYDVKASLSSAWFKDYGREEGDKRSFYRHYLRPEVTYWNMPWYNPLRLPYFQPYDWGWVDRTSRNLPVREGDNPLGGVNALTYGFSSNLLRRTQNIQDQTVVKDLFWFRLGQSYFLNDESMGIDGRREPHRRFSDFLGEAEVHPTRQLTLGSELGVAPYHQGLTRATARATFFDLNRQNFVSVNYLYIKDYANQVNVATYLDLLPSVKTWLTASHTFLNNNKLERQYGVVFQQQCWGVAFTYTDRPDDQRLSFTLIIPGVMEKFKKPPMNIPGDQKVSQEPGT